MTISDIPSPISTTSPPHADGEILVRVEEVSKKFCRSLKRSLWYGMQDIASELNPFGRASKVEVRRSEIASPDSDLPFSNLPSPIASSIFHLPSSNSLRPDEFWAVREVSFQLRRGECLALIGRNGAGKTTLLKMLNGLIKPDHGSIEMRGRIGALIALGAGFNPILSGRENIYVNASILGLSKREIDEKVDEIIDFAEIEQFIDAPVQSYSSGMQVRLGFAVATALKPDVLILDEVLAVGDAAFRAKCYRRIVSLRKKAAVIFVTHTMEQVARICDIGLLLSKGSVLHYGDVSKTILEYERINEVGMQQDESFLSLHTPITKFQIADLPGTMASGETTEFVFLIESQLEISDFRIRISFYNPAGSIAAEVNQNSEHHNILIVKGRNTFRLTLPCLPLREGSFHIGVNLIDCFGDILIWSYKEFTISVSGISGGINSDCQIPVRRWINEILSA